METVSANSWNKFESQLLAFQTGIRAAQQARPNAPGANILYRGQSDASWGLQTTLERYNNLTSVSKYYRSSYASLTQIEAHTGRKWDILGWDKFRELSRNPDTNFNVTFPGYEYFAYLRHHGFPSPLLDWSRSPYVAAFFAFRHAAQKQGNVAIYMFCSDLGLGRAGAVGEPTIYTRGPYVSTHARHFLQQSEYTISVTFRDGEWHYSRHEDALTVVGDRPQDILWKLEMPVQLRETMLSRLDVFNLNAYSLFQTEDTLMEMMARRELNAAHR